MKRLVSALTITVFLSLATVCTAANFYWKDTYAALAAISGLATGDRGIVITSAGVMSTYYYTGGAWVQTGTITTGQGTSAGSILLYETAANGTDYSSLTGATDAGSYPSFTFGGSQGGESLTLTAASNKWTFSSTTGVTVVDFSGINVVDTKVVTAYTTSSSLASTDMGKVFTNSGATANVILTLPDASLSGVTGRSITFVVMATQNFDINPYSTNRILGLTNANGDAIRNATIGGTITLLAISTTQWVVVSYYGTWTDVD